MKNLKSLSLLVVVAVAVMVAIGLSAELVMAQGGGGGGGHEPGATNNLSVPLINIGGSWAGVECTDAVDFRNPEGTPLAGYEINLEAYYYVQSVHTWQAECAPAESASAKALWGDNLAGDAKLKVGQPIRVEIGLESSESQAMNGFQVAKLEPSKLDRESAYGTVANCDEEMNCSATVTPFNSVRVFDSEATWNVEFLGDETYPIPIGTSIGSEINATGKAVYGYGLLVKKPGDYRITFNFPNVEITGINYGEQVYTNTVSLNIKVVERSGGGGGKPK